MAIKQYKPTSPARRGGQGFDFANLTPKAPEESLLVRIARTGGRNANGRITSRHRGGGTRRMYRIVDFRRDKDNVPARVAAIEYDPGRSARIALLHYRDGEKRYILAPLGLEVGMEVMSGEKVEPRVGNSMPLASIPLGLMVHNVEVEPGRGGQMGRSAGTAIQLTSREGHHAHLVMPSGELRKVHVRCRATIGQIGNVEHMNVSLGKAGRNRLKGWRPYVRGSAMNPYCHPLGGGEGRTGAGRPPCSPTGKPSKGGKTRNPRKTLNSLIMRRRRK